MNFISREPNGVVRKNGKVIRVIADINGKKIPFAMTGNRVHRDDPIASRTPLGLSAEEYKKLNRQLYAVFMGVKSGNGYGERPKNPRDAPKVTPEILAEAEHIHALIANYHERHPSLSWAKSARTVIKARNHREIPVEYKQDWQFALRRWGIKILEEGWLLIPRWERSVGEKKLVPQKVDGINSAIRMQDYIIAGYRVDDKTLSEISRLESIESVVRSANQLYRRWRTAGQAEKNIIQDKLIAVVLQLENCRNQFKVEAREQIQKAVDIEDALYRVNPGAKAARTISALENLGKRFQEVELIAPFAALRKEILVLEKRRMENKLRQAKNQLDMIFNQLKLCGKIFSRQAQAALNMEINSVQNFFVTIHISPYRELKMQVGYFLDQTKIKLATGEMLNTKLAINAARMILDADVSQFG